MSVRLHPRHGESQQVLDFSLETVPVSNPQRYDDSFGNICHLLNFTQIHSELTVRSVAELELAEHNEFVNEPQFDSWAMLKEEVDLVAHWDYLDESKFVCQGSTLESFMNACGIRKDVGPVSSILRASSALFRNLNYERGVTHVHSPTETILRSRRGVCQDYSHVLLSIARSWGIPSRYVSGYLRLDDSDSLQTPVGESHCWVEFIQPGRGWIGIDPANDTLADDRYVRVAVGRDYADVPPTKGIVFGAGRSAVDVQVVVERKSLDSADQCGARVGGHSDQ